MRKSFDLVVIGTGTAGSIAASQCRAAGWEVAIVDSRPFGGTCALRGCDPKKVLVGATEALDWARRMKGKGIQADTACVDWAELMRFKRTFVEQVPASKERGFAKAGHRLLQGSRALCRPDDHRGWRGHAGRPARARRVRRDACPPRFPGAEHLIDSTAFLELEALPRRIVFVGGGYISMEFAHVAGRAGAEVHVLHRGTRPLEQFDPDLVSRLVDATRALGIEVHLQSEVRRVDATASGVRVTTSQDRSIEADLAVHGAGRVPEIDDLDLAAGGVERNPSGVVVNEFLQSVSNPAVHAAGDAAATGAARLTPVSSMHGHVVASNMLKGNHRRPDHREVPSIVFTVPALAGVGLVEQDAREGGLTFDTHHEDTSAWYSTRRVGAEHSASKVLVERGSDRILGAHVLGIEAEAVINVFAIAMRAKMTAAEMKQTIFAYPTGASDIGYML
jgi:glutathione reductase (NADPH)